MSIAQGPRQPDDWKTELDYFERSTAAGVPMRGQVGARAVGLMFGLETTLNPFMYSGPYRDIADVPLAERVALMRDSDLRRRIIEGAHVEDTKLGSRAIHRFAYIFRLGDPPNYEPDPADSIQATADRDGRSPMDVAYDWLLEADGSALLDQPILNWGGPEPRRGRRHAPPSGCGSRTLRRWCSRRHDLRRQLPDHPAPVVGARPADRPHPGRDPDRQAVAG